MGYSHSVGGHTYSFGSLKELLAKATPARSGDYLAGIAAGDDEERVAAQMALADVPLKVFLTEAVIPYESDEVTRLIIDEHDARAFKPVAHLTVGGFRDWLLSDAASESALTALAPGLTPEIVAAVSKISRVQDLILIATEMPRRHQVPRHDRTEEAAGDPPPAEPSDRRPDRYRRQHRRWVDVRQWRRGDRHQPRDRQHRAGDHADRDAG